ncbi:sensor histidine kinase [Ideonella sp. BN130291]|uniref:sensor histidine kinase n=1 Tax=Ideonella sp. BN130291 TaxID=3112940 RepID=UPI002E262052|nr:HAMP domain-containing sensor histidine kinase [Ideonella sp. BN130291]
MKSLYLRIYLTIVAALLLFALVAGWLAQRHLDEERQNMQAVVSDRAGAWAALIENSLPAGSAPQAEQRAALLDWAQRLRMPLALDDAQGRRIATSESFARHEADPDGPARRALRVPLSDGRALWILRPVLLRAGPGTAAARPGDEPRPPRPPREHVAMALHYGGPPLFVGGVGLAAALVVLFVAVAVGAYPVVRRLTRRLEGLQQGVEAFGAGAFSHRVNTDGRDEVAALAGSFNRAADRIEQLLRSHQSLLANASHELRSPLARLKMALAMLEDAPPPQRARLRQEIDTNIAELDALVEEVLLASRLDAQAALERQEPVDMAGLAAEEGARVDAQLEATPALPQVLGDERLLRRALRNLLENARRYGGGDITLTLAALPGQVELRVCDRGPGVPQAMRDRIFEPFFRLPGHAEQAGGVGLGLSLVKQIAERHGGQVRCEAREGGGSCFVLSLPQGSARVG